MIIVAPQFPPAIKGGGPTKSLSGIAKIFDESEIDYIVITRNRDMDGTLLSESKFEKKAIYLPKITFKSIVPYFKNSKLIWINTIYSFRYSIIPLLAIFFIEKQCILLSPRGQLLKGALSKKKIIYLHIFKLLLKISRHNIVVHYTNEGERNKSINVFRNFKTIVFNNPVFGKIEEVETQKNKNIVLGFFGRISPIKNIEFIINLMPSLSSEIKFQIHGTFEDQEYKDRLDILIKDFNLQNRVTFFGDYGKSDFKTKAKKVDVFVIPSFSENFCHVFFEAIEMKKIVVASSGLPWEEANNKVSRTILDLKSNLWINRLEQINSYNLEEYTNEQEKLIEYYFKIQKSIHQNIINNFNELIKD